MQTVENQALAADAALMPGGSAQPQLSAAQLVYKNEGKLFVIAAVISGLVWLALILGTLGIFLLYMLAIYVFFLFAHSAFISWLKGTAVKITPAQFPDLHQRLLSCCQRLGMANIPKAYIVHADGIFNALATRFLGKHYVVLFSDIVDALESRPEAINFYIGHELGHIRRGHLVWGPLLWPGKILPLLGAALSRAEEYSCDLHGLACCADRESAQRAMAALAAGHTRWSTLNLSAYDLQVAQTSGFWMSFHELTGDYPWLVKRLRHIAQAPARVDFPRRSFWAGLLALFVPRLGLGPAGPLVVVAMIGIMAAVAIPAYQDYMAKAALTQAHVAGSQATQALSAFYAEHEALPADLTELDLLVPEGVDMVLDEHVLVLSLSQKPVAGASLSYVPDRDENGALSWICYGSASKDALLPAACQSE